jgi:hypothetical protein
VQTQDSPYFFLSSFSLTDVDRRDMFGYNYHMSMSMSLSMPLMSMPSSSKLPAEPLPQTNVSPNSQTPEAVVGLDQDANDGTKTKRIGTSGERTLDTGATASIIALALVVALFPLIGLLVARRRNARFQRSVVCIDAADSERWNV